MKRIIFIAVLSLGALTVATAAGVRQAVNRTRKWRLAVVSLVALGAADQAVAQQPSTVSNMPYASTPLSGSELFYLVQGGVSKKLTASTLIGQSALLSSNNTWTGNNTWIGTATFLSAITYGGVMLANSVTGTGSMVLSASPTLTGTVTIGTIGLQDNGNNQLSFTSGKSIQLSGLASLQVNGSNGALLGTDGAPNDLIVDPSPSVTNVDTDFVLYPPASAGAYFVVNSVGGANEQQLIIGSTGNSATKYVISQVVGGSGSYLPLFINGGATNALEITTTPTILNLVSATFQAGALFTGSPAYDIDLNGSTPSVGQIRLANNSSIYSENSAGNAAVSLITLSSSNIEFLGFPNIPVDIPGTLSVGSSILSTSPSGGVGYATGAGGTVTQATSKATGVALNKLSGAITMNNAALAAGAIVSFVLTDTSIGATDTLDLNHISGGTIGGYALNAAAVAGSATIYVRNATAGSLSEAIVIEFNVIKGVTS